MSLERHTNLEIFHVGRRVVGTLLSRSGQKGDPFDTKSLRRDGRVPISRSFTTSTLTLVSDKPRFRM